MKIYQHKAIRAIAALGIAATVGFAPTAVAQESTPLWSISEDLVNINRDIRISYDNIDVTQGEEATEEPSSVDPDAAENPDITFSTTDNTAWFSVDSRTGEITVNPGTEVPPSEYTFLITVNYGSSLTRTGQEYVQNVRARVTVHAQGYAPETSSPAADATDTVASTPASTTAASLPDLTPALTDLINQGATNLQDLINQIQQQTNNATADAAASLQNLQTLLETARAQADEALQAEIDRLLALINEAAATAAQAAQDAAAAAQDAVNQGVSDASAAVSSAAAAASSAAAAASSQAAAAAADAAAVASSASAAASSAAAAAVDGVRDVTIDINGNVDIQGPDYNVTPEQIAEFNRLLAERTRAFLEASGVDFNLTSEELAITLNGVVNISALLEDPAAFYAQLNQLLEQAVSIITDGSIDINVELPNIIDDINTVIDDAITEITENTDATTNADATAAAADTSAIAATTSAETTNTSKRETLANTGPEVLAMIFAAVTLGGAGFLMTKRGARS